MSQKVFFLLICAMIATMVLAGEEALVLEQQQRTMRTLVSNMQILDLVAADATDSDRSDGSMIACFNSTQRKQIENLASFQTQMRVCEKAEIDSKDQLSRQSNATRSGLVQRGTLHCESMRKCESLSDGLDFFTCYGKATSTSSEDLQNMSLTSNDQVENMKMEYQQISFDHNKCNIKARNTYASASAETDKEMQNCIMQSFQPPSASSSVAPPSDSTASE